MRDCALQLGSFVLLLTIILKFQHSLYLSYSEEIVSCRFTFSFLFCTVLRGKVGRHGAYMASIFFKYSEVSVVF